MPTRLEAEIRRRIRELELNSRLQTPTTSERAVYAELKRLIEILDEECPAAV